MAMSNSEPPQSGTDARRVPERADLPVPLECLLQAVDGGRVIGFAGGAGEQDAQVFGG
jgi:hypothetical protein